MSAQITVQVSDHVVARAKRIAEQNHQSIEDVLAKWLEWVVTEQPVETLSDPEVLTLTELQFTPDQQIAFSDLLARNKEDALQPEDQQQLDELMRIYEHGLLRKAQALRVAVQRGLMEPLQS
jgi:hypothetical protein